jgi:hypothetical protein
MAKKRRESLAALIHHFNGVFRKEIVAAGDAIIAKDWDALGALQAKVADSEIVTSIHELLRSSRASFEEFRTKLEASFPAPVLKLLAGGAIGLTGGLLLTTGSAALYVLGVLLICLGLIVALGAVWELALSVLNQGEFASAPTPTEGG